MEALIFDPLKESYVKGLFSQVWVSGHAARNTRTFQVILNGFTCGSMIVVMRILTRPLQVWATKVVNDVKVCIGH